MVVFDEAVAHIDTLKAQRSLDLLLAKLDHSIELGWFITHREDVHTGGPSVTAVLRDGATSYI